MKKYLRQKHKVNLYATRDAYEIVAEDNNFWLIVDDEGINMYIPKTPDNLQLWEPHR